MEKNIQIVVNFYGINRNTLQQMGGTSLVCCGKLSSSWVQQTLKKAKKWLFFQAYVSEHDSRINRKKPMQFLNEFLPHGKTEEAL